MTFDRFYVPDVRSTERPRRALALINGRLSRSQAAFRRKTYWLASKHRRGLRMVRFGASAVPPWAA